jgi:hypothetical protein
MATSHLALARVRVSGGHPPTVLVTSTVTSTGLTRRSLGSPRAAGTVRTSRGFTRLGDEEGVTGQFESPEVGEPALSRVVLRHNPPRQSRRGQTPFGEMVFGQPTEVAREGPWRLRPEAPSSISHRRPGSQRREGQPVASARRRGRSSDRRPARAEAIEPGR